MPIKRGARQGEAPQGATESSFSGWAGRRTTGTGGHRSGLVHDASDGARAAAALGAAAEAAIDLPRVSRRRVAAERRSHVVVAQHVARTDDHGGNCSRRFLVLY